jgi:hypothetical protein
LAGRGELVKTPGKFAAEQQVSEQAALKVGLEQKAKEFTGKSADAG